MLGRKSKPRTLRQDFIIVALCGAALGSIATLLVTRPVIYEIGHVQGSACAINAEFERTTRIEAAAKKFNTETELDQEQYSLEYHRAYHEYSNKVYDCQIGSRGVINTVARLIISSF
ncbi:MAG: hypothetical protein EBQ96_07985 [Proteobacteria bacterium]|nr:hypothetical protein [Pseudomonadota bacterium]